MHYTGDSYREKESETWAKAACLKWPAQWWDLLDSGHPTQENLEAIEICEFCPIKQQCLQEAYEQETRLVVRAGLLWGVNAKPRTYIKRPYKKPRHVWRGKNV